MEKEKSNYVAYKDHIDIKSIWHRCIEGCVITFGTPAFKNRVLIFENTLINVEGGAELYDKVQKKKDEIDIWKENQLMHWTEEHDQEAQTPSFVRDQRDSLDNNGFLQQYRFMVQLLQDNNFMLYKSQVREDGTVVSD